MRTHYGPWQPCWISNQHQKHKSGRGPFSEHFWQVWLKSVQRFQRRRFKCEKLTDGRTDAYPWPMARWAKNGKTKLYTTEIHVSRKCTLKDHFFETFLILCRIKNKTYISQLTTLYKPRWWCNVPTLRKTFWWGIPTQATDYMSKSHEGIQLTSNLLVVAAI